jgi:hypothetical protein
LIKNARQNPTGSAFFFAPSTELSVVGYKDLAFAKGFDLVNDVRQIASPLAEGILGTSMILCVSFHWKEYWGRL